MRNEIRFSGFGGQGIILSAVILGRAAVMYDNKFAVQTQVYGPEARGGASMSQVIIDDEEILYPKVANPGIYVIMSQEGFEKYGTGAEDPAVMLVDSTLVHSRPKCRCIEIPATQEGKSEPESHCCKYCDAGGACRGDKGRKRRIVKESHPRLRAERDRGPELKSHAARP